MKRLFWLGIGVATGVAVTRKARSTAHKGTPAGIAENLSSAAAELAAAIGSFGADVRAGMAEREQELERSVRERTGVTPGPARTRFAETDTANGARARRADG